MNDLEPLTPEEQAAFDALPRALEPRPDLERRVVKQLRAAGMLHQRRSQSRAVAAAAATLVIFAAGFAAGRAWTIERGATTGQRYLLLLYGAQAAPSDAEAARVAEYSAWARQEAAAGRLLSGERLGDDAIVLGRDQASGELANPSGFFVIGAASQTEAEATAARCPHLRHGGTIVLKGIIETGGGS